MMRKTLLLVFIHGFKGGDDTFGNFPQHIAALVSHALPKVSVVAEQYPKFDTRGELRECVVKFRGWLEDKVIDLEVENQTPSPTIDPSVHVILIGHSMGGIIAAETLLLLANERPVYNPLSRRNSTQSTDPSESTTSDSRAESTYSDLSGSKSQYDTHDHHDDEPSGSLFPHVQAILAFDTPYLGLAPEMVAHGLEGGHKMATNAWETANEVASIFRWGSKGGSAPTTPPATVAKSPPAFPLPSPDANIDVAAAPKWQSWGRYAMFAGAAGAVAAGGAAALYSQREKLSAGWTWATSHLLFVGDLAKAEHLKRRVETVERVIEKRELGGFGNFYTNLGKGAREGYGITEKIGGKERTFCNLPKRVKDRNNSAASTESELGQHDAERGSIDSTDQNQYGKLRWMKAVNEKAKDETSAHISIFFPRDNPGFYALAQRATEVVRNWVDQEWYDTATGIENGLFLSELSADQEMGEDDVEHVAKDNTFEVNAFEKEWEGVESPDEAEAEEEDVEMLDERKENEHELEDSVMVHTKSAPPTPMNQTPNQSVFLRRTVSTASGVTPVYRNSMASVFGICGACGASSVRSSMSSVSGISEPRQVPLPPPSPPSTEGKRSQDTLSPPSPLTNESKRNQDRSLPSPPTPPTTQPRKSQDQLPPLPPSPTADGKQSQDRFPSSPPSPPETQDRQIQEVL